MVYRWKVNWEITQNSLDTKSNFFLRNVKIEKNQLMDQ